MRTLIVSIILIPLIHFSCANRASTPDAVAYSYGIEEIFNPPKRTLDLTEIYTQAIDEFINAAKIHSKITYDTLYFGKRNYGLKDDFPDIVLPSTIENTHIRLIAPEMGMKWQKERKSLVYINMIGWVEKEEAEFLMVVFSNGAQHQYDYHIHFTYDDALRQYKLDNIQFEDFLHLDGQKPNRIFVYKEGKYLEPK
jgi:hypothetical protein